MIISTKNKGWTAVFNEIKDQAEASEKHEHYLVVPQLLIGSFKNYARTPSIPIVPIDCPFNMQWGRNKFEVIVSEDLKHKILFA